MSSNFSTEIKRRRTFAIISHPGAGKTSLTECEKRNRFDPRGEPRVRPRSTSRGQTIAAVFLLDGE